MEIQEQIAVIVHTISHQGGRIDALHAALSAVLRMAKDTPQLHEAIESRLEQQYAGILAGSENPQYVAGFESMRDMLLAVIKD